MQKDTRMRRSLSMYLRDMEDRGLTVEYTRVSRHILGKFVEHCEQSGVTATSKITVQELRGFMQKYQGMSANYQGYAYACLKQFLKFSEHPLAFKWRWRITGRPRQVSWLSAEEAEKVLTSKMKPTEAFLVVTGLLAGARQVEIRRLTPRDLKDALSTGQVRLWAKNKQRYVWVHRDLKPVFEAMLHTTDRADSEPILGLSGCSCGRILRKFSARIGVKVQSHKCRRTFATLVRDAGTPLEDVSALLGHSSPAVTSLYLDLNQARMKAAIERLRVQSPLKPVKTLA
jgi:integrase